MAREPLHHNFAIWPLKAGVNGDGKSNRVTRLYYCLRCRWKFAVHGRLIAALDESERPLAGAEGLERVATFASGPCPALAAVHRHPKQ